MTRILFLFGISVPFDPEFRFETSATLPTVVLACLRTAFAVYCLVGIIIKFALPRDGETAGQSFSYFSNITYWGIAGYFWVSSFHTWMYIRTGAAPLNHWPKPLQLLHSLLFTTIVTLPFTVTIVFWSIQFNSSKYATAFDAWSNTSRHALNSAFALFEIIFSRSEPLPWIHLPFIPLFLGGYAGIAYITHATEGFYTYGFLDPTKHRPGVLAAIIIGIGAGSMAWFGVVRIGIWVRLWITKDLEKSIERGSADSGSMELYEHSNMERK